MNANEYKLEEITYKIQFYEQNNPSVIEYNSLKKERGALLNELKRNW